MAAPDHGDDIFDRFMAARDIDATSWERDHNKKCCPDCGGVHDDGARRCSVCGWTPEN